VDAYHATSPAELAEFLVERLQGGSELVAPIANGEPIRLMAELEQRSEDLREVKLHQMHALRDRPYLHGTFRGRLEQCRGS